MTQEFDTFAEADAYLRRAGYSALSIATDDHYAARIEKPPEKLLPST